MMIRLLARTVPASILWLTVACGPNLPAAPAPTAGGSAGTSPTLAPPPPAAATDTSPGINVEAINVCRILPRAELASLAGGTPYEAEGPDGPACIYTIDPGDGTAELYSISVTAPDVIAPMIDYVRQYEEAEWLESIGDAAYLQASDLGEGYDIVVLIEGKYGLSLGGPQPEVLQAAARLIVERLAE